MVGLVRFRTRREQVWSSSLRTYSTLEDGEVGGAGSQRRSYRTKGPNPGRRRYTLSTTLKSGRRFLWWRSVYHINRSHPVDVVLGWVAGVITFWVSRVSLYTRRVTESAPRGLRLRLRPCELPYQTAPSRESSSRFLSSVSVPLDPF